MTRYLLDSNQASIMFRQDARFREAIRAHAGEEILLPMPVVGELWFMVFNSARFGENSAKLGRLLAKFTVVPFDLGAAEEFGRIRAELRRTGRPIPQIDTQIAAIARLNDLVVVTADSHFQNVRGLRTENWMHP